MSLNGCGQNNCSIEVLSFNPSTLKKMMLHSLCNWLSIKTSDTRYNQSLYLVDQSTDNIVSAEGNIYVVKDIYEPIIDTIFDNIKTTCQTNCLMLIDNVVEEIHKCIGHKKSHYFVQQSIDKFKKDYDDIRQKADGFVCLKMNGHFDVDSSFFNYNEINNKLRGKETWDPQTQTSALTSSELFFRYCFPSSNELITFIQNPSIRYNFECDCCNREIIWSRRSCVPK
jgi:hypothetical protein